MMNGLLKLVLVGLVLALGADAQTANAPAKPIAVTIDAGKTGAPISPYIYGKFIEHIGPLINRSVWAEMLDDRKFYYAIDSKPRDERPQRGRVPNRWLPIGPDESVVMNRDDAYVGEHSPKILLSGAAPRGIQQAGLALETSRGYEGRVVLAGDPGANVTVSLVWGDGPASRQTIPISGLATDYVTFPLEFTALAGSDNGRLEIAGTGEGSFHVGAVSLMPADNIFGFRADTTMLLRSLRSGMYRWPGGNFLSAHEWRNAIGDPDKRPPTWDAVRSGPQPNDVGTDEFMTLMELLGVEPFISVSSGFGDAWSAAQLVEYANGSIDTPMGKLRAANGHPKPYDIKWWGIGNEMYGSWQFGQMALEQYVIKHNMFAEAMRKVDPTITLLATGATPDEMTIYGLSLGMIGKLIPEFGSDADWTGGLFTHCFDNIDVMSEHFYSYAGQRFDHSSGVRPGSFSRSDYMVEVDEPLVEWARRPANRVRNKVEAYEEYLQRIPALKTRRIPMAIDEWAYTRAGNLRGALANAMVLQEMLRHSDLIIMAGHTMGMSSIDYNDTEAALNTNGLLFKLYRDRFGTVPVEVGGSSPVPAPLYPVGADQPKVNAGSPTYPVDVSAALTSDGKYLTVAVINANESAQELDLSYSGIQLAGKGRLWRMTADSLDAATGLGRNEVQIVETPVDDPTVLKVLPISVNIYEFERQ